MPHVHRASGSRSVWAAAGLAAAILVCAAGIATTQIFSQMPWSPTGLHRFLVYTSIFVVLCAACYLTRRGLIAAIAVVIAAAYTVTFAGWEPLLALGLFAAGSFGIGVWLLRPLGLSHGQTPAAILFTTGAAVWALLGGLLALTHWNSGWHYGVLLAIPALTQIRRLADSAIAGGKALSARLQERAGFWSSAMLVYALGAQWLMCLKPEVSADGIAMHLAVPMHLARWHYWHFDITRASWAVMPMGADWCTSMVYGIGGEYGAKLLPLLFLVVTVSLLQCMCRRWVSAPVATLIASAYAVTPLVQLTTGSLFVENLLALLLLAGLFAVIEAERGHQPAWLALAGLLLGAAMSVKFGAGAFVLPCAAWIVWIIVSERGVPGILRSGVLTAVLFLVFAVPPYLIAYLKTGNPVFPFLNGVFRSPYFDVSTNNPDSRFSIPLAWYTPFDMTFHTSWFLEGGDGAIGFVYLFALVLLIVGVGAFRDVAIWKFLALAVASVFMTWQGVSYVRYTLPALLVILLAAAAALASLRNLGGRGYSIAITCIALLSLAGVYLLPVSGYWHREFCLSPLHFQHESEEYIEQHAPSRILVGQLNRAAPGEPVLFLTNGIAGLEAPAYIMGWHGFTFYKEVSAAHTSAEVDAIMRTKGIRYFLVCLEPCEPAFPFPLAEFMRIHTRERMRAGGAFVAERLD